MLGKSTRFGVVSCLRQVHWFCLVGKHLVLDQSLLLCNVSIETAHDCVNGSRWPVGLAVHVTIRRHFIKPLQVRVPDPQVIPSLSEEVLLMGSSCSDFNANSVERLEVLVLPADIAPIMEVPL